FGARYLGSTPKQIIGKQQKKFFPPKTAKLQQQMREKVIRSGKPLENENMISFYKKDLWIHTKLSPIKDGKGRVRAVLGISRDITDRKKVELELIESKDLYQSMVETSPDSVTVTDLEGKLIMANQRAADLHGCKDPRELIGKDAFLLIAPKDLKLAEINARKTLEQGGIRNVEYTFLKKDGSTFLGEINTSVILDARNCPKGFIGIVRDITDRKKAEEVIIESEKQYRTTINSISDAIHVVNEELRIILINNSFLRWSKKIGLKTDLLGKKLKQAFPFLPETVFKEYEHTFRTKSPLVTEETNKIEEKDVITEIMKIPIFEKNKVVRILTIIRDITDRRKTEAELIKTQKLESLGILAGGIAHDFNNILTSILGNINVARMEGQPIKEIQESLEKAEKAVFIAKDLTQQLLTFSKGGEPIKKLLLLPELLKDSINFALSGSNIKCECKIEENLLPIEADEAQFSQVINNLMINSIQAMPGGGKIKVKAENIIITKESSSNIKPGRYIMISLADSGTGIPKKYLDKIFDPYFTTKLKGSGLGLTITYSIIKKHEGYIKAESRSGIGTTFYLFLPASTQKIKKPGNRDKTMAGSTGKILFMDDEPAIRDNIAQSLSSMGYEVQTTRDGSETIELYKKALKEKKPFDVLIIDLTIPGGMGGKETIQKLLKIDPKVKAVVSSGYSQNPVMAQYIEYGFKDVITKPYRITIINSILQKLLNSG
ncbi:MAG: PAS domain S-box protein, partial [Spirochaetes bacterium]|nr:PAS domain S-box protein [Spirochaetota bacterium]